MNGDLNWAEQWVSSRLRFDGATGNQAQSLPETANEWSQVLKTARKFRLSGLLMDRLPVGALPELVRAQLERTRGAIRHKNLHAWLALEEWLERFQTDEIPVVVLKGAALTKLVYGSLERRPMTDIDLLVEREDFLRAGQRLKEAGLVRAVDVEGNEQMPRTQAMFCTSRSSPIFIDLHWHLLDSSYYVRRVPMRWFWEHTIVLGEGTPAMRVLSPEAQLLHLAAHLELHHAGASLLSLYDVAALVDHFGSSMNWDLVLAAATHFQWEQSLRGVVQRAQEIFGIAVPVHVNASLSGLRGTYRERLARTLATAEAHPAAFILDGWDQDDWRQRLSYWKRSLFPSKAFMCVRNQDGSSAFLWQYMQRLARGLIRIPRALAASAVIFWRLGATRTASTI